MTGCIDIIRTYIRAHDLGDLQLLLGQSMLSEMS